MLEDLNRTPDEKRTTEIIVHLGVIAFVLYALAELVTGLGAPVVFGVALGVVGVLYAQWLYRRWREESEMHPAREAGHALRRLEAM